MCPIIPVTNSLQASDDAELLGGVLSSLQSFHKFLIAFFSLFYAAPPVNHGQIAHCRNSLMMLLIPPQEIPRSFAFAGLIATDEDAPLIFRLDLNQKLSCQSRGESL